jgi:hypothetical protein
MISASRGCWCVKEMVMLTNVDQATVKCRVVFLASFHAVCQPLLVWCSATETSMVSVQWPW